MVIISSLEKNPETDKSCPGILIPNTIIYRFDILIKDGLNHTFGILHKKMEQLLEKQKRE